jgi:hypothetical protein
MYPSLFGFKKLTDQHEIVKNNNIKSNMDNTIALNQTLNQSNQNIYNDYDSVSITNNIEEFKSLFKTQENACYELRSENTVLKMKLEVANETIRIQSNRIKSLKMKKNNLKIENNVYKNVLSGSSLSFSNFNNNSHHSKFNNNCLKNDEQSHSVPHSYPPPPPPPLPLPPPNIITQNKIKVYGNSQMNNVLDELKSKIKQID